MHHAVVQAIVPGHMSRRNGFNPRPSPCRIWGGKSDTGAGSPVSVILSMIHTPSFIYHRRYIICAIDSVVGSSVTSDDSYSERPGFKPPPGDRLSRTGLSAVLPIPSMRMFAQHLQIGHDHLIPDTTHSGGTLPYDACNVRN